MDLSLPLFSEKQLKLKEKHETGSLPCATISKGLDIQERGNVVNYRYCEFSQEIEDRLAFLHDLLRNGHKTVQKEIDRYLFVCGPVLTTLLPRETFVTPYSNTICAEILPNVEKLIISVLKMGENEHTNYTQFLRQCLPLKRRTKRAQREIVWIEVCVFLLFLGFAANYL